MAREQIDKLTVGGTFTTRRRLFETDKAAGQMLLQKAKLGKLSALCICKGDSHAVPMTIVSKDNSYHLRRLPLKGSQHHQDCVSYGGINERAEKIYTDDAIWEVDDKVLVRVDGPLSELKNAREREPAGVPRGPATERQRRGSMSLLGLLNYLWEEAQINIWRPGMAGKRWYGKVRALLLEQCASRFFADGQAMPNKVFVVAPSSKKTPFDNDAALKSHLAALNPDPESDVTHFGLVIGEIKRLIEPRAGQSSSGIVLDGMDGAPLWDNHRVLKRLDDSFEYQLARHRARAQGDTSNDYRLFGIFSVALNKKGDGFVLKQGAVMESSQRFIPIASDCEGKVERKLVDEGRAFEKPLVYDGERSFFPDFYLLDTALTKKPVLEVYGYSGDKYEAQKRAKHVEYVRTRTPYWYWDVKLSPHDIPSFDQFPPRRSAQ